MLAKAVVFITLTGAVAAGRQPSQSVAPTNCPAAVTRAAYLVVDLPVIPVAPTTSTSLAPLQDEAAAQQPPELTPASPAAQPGGLISGTNDADGFDAINGRVPASGEIPPAAPIAALVLAATTELAAARTAVAVAGEARDRAQTRVSEARAALSGVLDAFSRTSQARQRAAAQAAAALQQLQERALAGFVAGSTGAAAGWLQADGDPVVALAMSQSVANSARDAAAVWRDEVARSDRATASLACALTDARSEHGAAQLELSRAVEFLDAVEQTASIASVRVAVLTASDTAGALFPVQGPSWYTDTWGAARSGGRLHQGVDFIAAWGTPVVAAEAGVVARIGWDVLGGWRVSLLGRSGTYYYYAHLAAYPAGLELASSVATGQVIGWVGDTGNASGVPHLHWEVHPHNGAAVNPYQFARSLQARGATLALAPLPLDGASRSSLAVVGTAQLPRMPTHFALVPPAQQP